MAGSKSVFEIARELSGYGPAEQLGPPMPGGSGTALMPPPMSAPALDSSLDPSAGYAPIMPQGPQLDPLAMAQRLHTDYLHGLAQSDALIQQRIPHVQEYLAQSSNMSPEVSAVMPEIAPHGRMQRLIDDDAFLQRSIAEAVRNQLPEGPERFNALVREGAEARRQLSEFVAHAGGEGERLSQKRLSARAQEQARQQTAEDYYAGARDFMGRVQTHESLEAQQQQTQANIEQTRALNPGRGSGASAMASAAGGVGDALHANFEAEINRRAPGLQVMPFGAQIAEAINPFDKPAPATPAASGPDYNGDVAPQTPAPTSEFEQYRRHRYFEKFGEAARQHGQRPRHGTTGFDEDQWLEHYPPRDWSVEQGTVGEWSRQNLVPQATRDNLDKEIERDFRITKLQQERARITAEAVKQTPVNPDKSRDAVDVRTAVDKALQAKGMPGLRMRIPGFNSGNPRDIKPVGSYAGDLAGDVGAGVATGFYRLGNDPVRFLLAAADKLLGGDSLAGHMLTAKEEEWRAIQNSSEFGPSQRAKDNPLGVHGIARSISEEAPGLAATIASGGTAGMGRSGAATLAGKLGLSAKRAAQLVKTGEQLPKYLSMANMGLREAEGSREELYQLARQKGMSEDAARDLALQGGLVVGVVNGFLEKIPFGEFVTKNPAARKALLRITSGAMAEGATETAQEFTALAATYGYQLKDPEVKDLERLLQAAIVAGLLGGGTGGVQAMAQQYRDRMPPGSPTAGGPGGPGTDPAYEDLFDRYGVSGESGDAQVGGRWEDQTADGRWKTIDATDATGEWQAHFAQRMQNATTPEAREQVMRAALGELAEKQRRDEIQRQYDAEKTQISPPGGRGAPATAQNMYEGEVVTEPAEGGEDFAPFSAPPSPGVSSRVPDGPLPAQKSRADTLADNAAKLGLWAPIDAMSRQGTPDAEIARQLGLSEEAVAAVKGKMGNASRAAQPVDTWTPQNPVSSAMPKASRRNPSASTPSQPPIAAPGANAAASLPNGEASPTFEQVSQMPVLQLRGMARKLGLPQGGTRKDLVQRILKVNAAHAGSATSKDGGPGYDRMRQGQQPQRTQDQRVGQGKTRQQASLRKIGQWLTNWHTKNKGEEGPIAFDQEAAERGGVQNEFGDEGGVIPPDALDAFYVARKKPLSDEEWSALKKKWQNMTEQGKGPEAVIAQRIMKRDRHLPLKYHKLARHVDEDGFGELTKEMDATAIAKLERAMIGRITGTKKDNLDEALAAAKSSNDPQAIFSAWYYENAPPFGERVPQEMFDTGNLTEDDIGKVLEIHGVKFRVGEEGGILTLQDHITIPHADTLGKIPIDAGTFGEPDVALKDESFTAGLKEDSRAPTTPENYTGGQNSLLGEKPTEVATQGGLFGRGVKAAAPTASAPATPATSKDVETPDMFGPSRQMTVEGDTATIQRDGDRPLVIQKGEAVEVDFGTTRDHGIVIDFAPGVGQVKVVLENGQDPEGQWVNADAIERAKERSEKTGVMFDAEVNEPPPPDVDEGPAAPFGDMTREPAPVTPTAPKVALDDIPLDLATRAHAGISHVPAQRGEADRRRYVEHMNDVHESMARLAETPEQKAILATEFERYRQGYVTRAKAMLEAQARVMSPMITGPARFPTDRNRKRSDTATRRASELVEWNERARQAMREKIKPSEAVVISSDRPDAPELLQKKIAEAEAKQSRMKAINAAHKAFVKDAASLDQSDLSEQDKKFIRNWKPPVPYETQPFPGYALQNNLANIKRMKDRVARIEGQRAKPSSEREFVGGKIVDNADANRVQILFDEKPPQAMITRLKLNGFRWAPSEKAWQRFRGPATERAIEQLGLEFNKGETTPVPEKSAAPAKADASTPLPPAPRGKGLDLMRAKVEESRRKLTEARKKTDDLEAAIAKMPANAFRSKQEDRLAKMDEAIKTQEAKVEELMSDYFARGGVEPDHVSADAPTEPTAAKGGVESDNQPADSGTVPAPHASKASTRPSPISEPGRAEFEEMSYRDVAREAAARGIDTRIASKRELLDALLGMNATHTRESMQAMNSMQVHRIAQGMGLPNGTKDEQIAAILKRQGDIEGMPMYSMGRQPTLPRFRKSNFGGGFVVFDSPVDQAIYDFGQTRSALSRDEYSRPARRLWDQQYAFSLESYLRDALPDFDAEMLEEAYRILVKDIPASGLHMPTPALGRYIDRRHYRVEAHPWQEKLKEMGAALNWRPNFSFPQDAMYSKGKVFTREQLDAMVWPELQEIRQGMGLPVMGRAALVDAIFKKQTSTGAPGEGTIQAQGAEHGRETAGGPHGDLHSRRYRHFEVRSADQKQGLDRVEQTYAANLTSEVYEQVEFFDAQTPEQEQIADLAKRLNGITVHFYRGTPKPGKFNSISGTHNRKYPGHIAVNALLPFDQQFATLHHEATHDLATLGDPIFARMISALGNSQQQEKAAADFLKTHPQYRSYSHDQQLEEVVAHAMGFFTGGTDFSILGGDQNFDLQKLFFEAFRRPEQFETRSDTAADAGDDPRFAIDHAPTFYHKSERVIGEKMPERALPLQVIGILDNAGIKLEERKWLGLDDLLRNHKGPITKQEVLDHIHANRLDIREVMKSRDELDAVMEEVNRLGGLESDAMNRLSDALEEAGKGVKETERLIVDLMMTGEVEDALNRLPKNLRKLGEEFVAAKDRRAQQEDRVGDVQSATKYESYTSDGGTDYRELLLTLPERKDSNTEKLRQLEEKRFALRSSDPGYLQSLRTLNEQIQEAENAMPTEAQAEAKDFRSSHFDEPNILAHVRFNTRTDADGNKVLFLEEVQSDWLQEARQKGFASENATRLKEISDRIDALQAKGTDASTEEKREWAKLMNDRTPLLKDLGVPDAPFKNTWHELVIRRMVRYAAENGYDKLALTTGEIQADRYDLSEKIDELIVEPVKDGSGDVRLTAAKGNRIVIPQGATQLRLRRKELADHIGKEMSEKALSAIDGTNEPFTAKGLDLRVGGEGMRTFYDQILPNYARKFVKKWGATVGTTRIATGKETSVSSDPAKGTRVDETFTEVPSIDITPEMRMSVLSEGMPMFSMGDIAAAMKNAVKNGIEGGMGAVNYVAGEMGRPLSKHPTGRALIRAADRVEAKVASLVGKLATRARDAFLGLKREDQKWLMEHDQNLISNYQRTMEDTASGPRMTAPNPRIQAVVDATQHGNDLTGDEAERVRLPRSDGSAFQKPKGGRFIRHMTPDMALALHNGSGPVFKALSDALVALNPGMSPMAVKTTLKAMRSPDPVKHSAALEHFREIKNFPSYLKLPSGEIIPALELDPLRVILGGAGAQARRIYVYEELGSDKEIDRLRARYVHAGGEERHFDNVLAILNRRPWRVLPGNHRAMWRRMARAADAVAKQAMLTLSVGPNFPQSAMVIPRTGLVNYIKAVVEFMAHPKASFSEMYSLGVMLPDLFDTSIQKGRIIEDLTRIVTGTSSRLLLHGTMNKVNAVISGLAFRNLADHWQRHGFTDADVATAQFLRLTPAQIAELRAGNPSRLTLHRIVREGVNRTQFMSEHPHRESALQNVPILNAIFTLNNYVIGMGRYTAAVGTEVADAIKSGKPAQMQRAGWLLFTTLATAIGVGLASRIIKRVMRAQRPLPKDEDFLTSLRMSLAEVAILGPVQRTIDAAGHGDGTLEQFVIGTMPTVRLLFDVAGAMLGVGDNASRTGLERFHRLVQRYMPAERAAENWAAIITGKKKYGEEPTKAEKLARDFGFKGDGEFTLEDRQRWELLREVTAARRAGDTQREQEAIKKAGRALSEADEANIATRLKYPTDLAYRLSRLAVADAVKVYMAMEPDEKRDAQNTLRDKIVRAKISNAEQDSLLKQTGIAPPEDLDLDRLYTRLGQLQESDSERRQRIESLSRRVAATPPGQEKMRLTAERDAAAREPQKLAGPDAALHRQLANYRERRNLLKKRVDEGSMTSEAAEKELEAHRQRLRAMAAGRRAA